MVTRNYYKNMEKGVGLSILESNDMQVDVHSGSNESQGKDIDRISHEEQKRSTRSRTINHLRLKPNVNKKKFFRCPDCDKVFTRVKNMLDHSAICKSRQVTNRSYSYGKFKDTIECSYVSNQIPTLIKCAICSASYISEDAFMGHMASYHGTHERMTIPTDHSDHLIACISPKCEFKTSVKAIPQAHIDAYHLRKHHQISIKYKGVKPFLPYKCQYCGASYVVESSLRRHMKTHNKNKKESENGSCKIITLNRKEKIQKNSLVACLPEKVDIVNEVQVVFHCEYCGKTVSGANQFADHVEKHSVKKLYKLQKEECAFRHDNVMYPGIEKVKCTREIDCVNISGDVNGDGECSGQEVEERIFSKEDSENGLSILAKKHNQKHIKAEIGDKEFLDTYNMVISDEECDVSIAITVEQDDTRKDSVLMKCNFCSAAFVSENILKKHLQNHKNKENRLKKYGWFGWELHSSSDVNQDHGVSNFEDETQTVSNTREASSQKGLEIKYEEVNESFGSENISVPKSYKNCTTVSEEMVKINIKEEPELEEIEFLKEELEW